MLKDFLIVVKAASTLDFHAETVRRFWRTGKLRSHKLLNGWLTPRTELESLASTYSGTRQRTSTAEWSGVGMTELKDLTVGVLVNLKQPDTEVRS